MNKKIIQENYRKCFKDKPTHYLNIPTNKIFDILTLYDDTMIAIKKPSIIKNITFDYSYNNLEYISYETALTNACSFVGSESFFKDINLKNIRAIITHLEKHDNVYYKYTDIDGVGIWNAQNGILMNKKDQTVLINIYQRLAENFEIRLDKYLQSHGLQNIKASTRCIDE